MEKIISFISLAVTNAARKLPIFKSLIRKRQRQGFRSF